MAFPLVFERKSRQAKHIPSRAGCAKVIGEAYAERYLEQLGLEDSRWAKREVLRHAPLLDCQIEAGLRYVLYDHMQRKLTCSSFPSRLFKRRSNGYIGLGLQAVWGKKHSKMADRLLIRQPLLFSEQKPVEQELVVETEGKIASSHLGFSGACHI